MKIRHILDRKGSEVRTISPASTVAEAVRLLVRHDIGSLVVTRGDEILGILTERDVLRLTDRDPGTLGVRLVEEEMTERLIVGSPEDDVAYAMEIMTRNRIRHLPVVREGRLEGLISIGDIVNALRRSVEAENRYLRDYVQGVVR
jgi:CBS domain-containing protein